MELELHHEFRFERVLNQNTAAKAIALLGEIRGEKAVALLEKAAFDEARASVTMEDTRRELSLLERNDVYIRYLSSLAPQAGAGVKTTIIWPATETHIRKYSAQRMRLVQETPEMYRNVTLPYISSMLGDRLRWVYNILDHVAEADSIISEDTDAERGYVLIPDMKWDRRNLDTLYLMAIVNRRDLRSLRDLTPQHIPLLQHLEASLYAAMQRTYGLDADQLRLFLHYQPSYYHLHIHVAAINHSTGHGMEVGRAHLLCDVIQQLQDMRAAGIADGFAARTIACAMGEQHSLYQALAASTT